jgi:hypothetical protein
MPYEIKKKSCKMKSGETGKAVRYRKITHGDGSVTLKKAACHKSVPAAYSAIGKIHDSHDPMLEDESDISEVEVSLTEHRIRIRDSLLESMTTAERREFEKIARRSARSEINNSIKQELRDIIRDEVSRAMKKQDISAEIESTAETVIRRLMREMLK